MAVEGQKQEMSGRFYVVPVVRTIIVTFFVGLVIGSVMAVVSNGFVIGVGWLADQRASLDFFSFNFGKITVSTAPLICLFIAAVFVILIKRIFRITRYHGPADSIYVAHHADDEPEWKAGIGSTLAAFVSASGGASVGQYGPLVHFGATVGSLVRRLTRGILTTEIFLGCGVAGAIAAGFNAPITGLVFAHEAILRNFSQKAIAPIAISSITAAAVSEWAFGDRNVLAIDHIAPNLVELMPYLLASGPVFGLIAITFMLSLRFSARFAANSNFSAPQLILLAALICGFVGMFIPEILGLGTEAVNDMFADGFEFSYLFILLIAKILMTAVCIGFGLFGGVFSPALFVGASIGAIANKIVAMMGLGAYGPSLAICGMAAVGAAVIGAPISTVLIVLEMTTSYEFAVAAMLSVVSCKIVSNVLFGHSFFDRQLLDRGINISLGRSHINLMDLSVMKYVAKEDFVFFNTQEKTETAIETMAKKGVTEAYILEDNKTFVGKISLQSLIKDGGLTVQSNMEESPLVIYSEDSVLEAIEKASNFVGESIPVLDKGEGKFLGVITEAALFQAYLSMQTKTRDLETS